MSTPHFTLVGIGESLYDVFPDRQVLGGAPLNFAVHAHRMASQYGGTAAIVSRIGQDTLGDALIDEVRQRGLNAACLQTDPDHPTGRVNIIVDAAGEPDYDIVPNVAWDWMQFDPDLESLARRCQAACFGTLSQRTGQSRNTIYRFLNTMIPGAVRMYDINLRQDFYNMQIIRRSLDLATVLKVNKEELPVVAQCLGTQGTEPDQVIKRAMNQYSLTHVVYTRGERGTVLYGPAGKTEGSLASYEPDTGADTVGAGDACAAVVLTGLLLNWPPDRIANTANRAGAFVASQQGATPEVPASILGL